MANNTNNRSAMTSAATRLLCEPLHTPNPQTSSTNPKSTPEISDALLPTRTNPAMPPKIMITPYTHTSIAVFSMVATLPDGQRLCPEYGKAGEELLCLHSRKPFCYK